MSSAEKYKIVPLPAAGEQTAKRSLSTQKNDDRKIIQENDPI